MRDVHVLYKCKVMYCRMKKDLRSVGVVVESVSGSGVTRGTR